MSDSRVVATVLVAATLGASCAGTPASPAKPAAAPHRLPQQSQEPPSPSTATSTAAAEPAPQEPEPAKKSASYYVAPRSNGTTRETEPPRYVRSLDQAEWFDGEGLDWLDVGVDYRIRYEYRDDDLRRPIATLDEPVLLRTRAYLGIHDRFDPFRAYLEFQDSRSVNSQFPEDTRDFNRNEVIQAIGELYFDDLLGEDRPLRLQGGRMAFEYTDRRLLARNEWRNTTNTFQGFRGILGQQTNDWQLDLLALKPVQRDTDDPDEPVDNQWLYGAIGDWRRWSQIVTLQPFYLVLKQQAEGAALAREIHTLGLRGYGNVSGTGYDYDLQGIGQWGESGPEDQEAWAATAEVGYGFESDWKPRLSAFFGYGSGDRAPGDGENNHFERLFGFSRPWSANDYVTFENIMAPKLRLEFQPHAQVRVDLGWSWFWLASDTDAWVNANLQDPTGQSGSHMGDEFDIRARFNILDRCGLTLGYAHFWPGEFTSNVGRDEDTDFFYIELLPRLFP